MAVLPPDPIFCLKSDMGYVHSMCFDENDGEFSDDVYAATESGFVYVWDLNVSVLFLFVEKIRLYDCSFVF